MRKLRDSVETVTDKIPGGPMGFTGGGTLIGGAGFFAVSITNGVIPLDEVDVGFNIESSSVERYPEDDVKQFEFVINAVSRDVAKFAAVFRSRASVVDNISRQAEILEVENIKERRWMSDWRIVVETRSTTPDQ